MQHQRLSRTFFNRPTLRVARELLGKFLVRRIGQKILLATCPAQNRKGSQRDIVLYGMITETEAYCGPNDLASHASRGRTPRTEVMFGPPGHAYVYLIYGMYHCLNVVTEKEGYPAAVLIRGAIIFDELNGPARQNFSTSAKGALAESMSKNLGGPGKLCRYFQIDRDLNKEDLTTSENLWFEDRGIKIQPGQIKCLPRIGINYAGAYKNKPWRFVLRR